MMRVELAKQKNGGVTQLKWKGDCDSGFQGLGPEAGLGEERATTVYSVTRKLRLT